MVAEDYYLPEVIPYAILLSETLCSTILHILALVYLQGGIEYRVEGGSVLGGGELVLC